MSRPHAGRASWRDLLALLLLGVLPAMTGAQSSAAGTSDSAITIIPRPTRLTPHTGQFVLKPTTTIWSDATSASLARQLAAYLEPATGFTLVIRSGGLPPGHNAIILRRDSTLRRLGAEGYTLEVKPLTVVARAPAAAGLFYAIQSIRQLLPPDVFRDAPSGQMTWTIPAVSIEDMPRFQWRGGHLDVARHFMPKEFVRKYIDLLALHKMNTFHWHLTEDQGWRLEIRRFPELTRVGAWRKESIIGRQGIQRDTMQWRYDGVRHGGFYTQSDAREIVAYAKARFVTVVPEIEMPGHAVAAIASYPELGVTGWPLSVMTRWGVSDDILNAEPATITFMQNVLTEVMEIFPSRYIHIGGDEAEKGKWRESPRIQERIRELGLKDEDALQSWFIGQMDAFLTRHGRRLVGWDEILEGGLAPNATVMSWRGIRGGLEAARADHDVIMAPNTFTYFDYYQSPDQETEPIAIGGYLTVDSVYAFDPMPAGLEPEYRHHVIGAQGQLWTEYMETPKKVEFMAFPRVSALAEVVWTPQEARNLRDFRRRLDTHLLRLQALDVNYRPPDLSPQP